MFEEPPRSKNPWWSIFRNTVALVAFVLVASQFIPRCGQISARGNLTKGIQNCRHVINALRTYAADHNGNYPYAAMADPQSSN
ncbi:hypothetical protein DES53_102513 [Roseimicrobium gellanilyticum]|uniref:DUF1559 domain-containing protein n=1 Tax=Roseimicrobium gellanilyticum TaxID=748857 RepID=A0A366HTU9_9BACT|nr:hypothetical protein [Roseimicrobium gellanilyticum]RBP46127.1 hypothetical protein DES53_102513 [Roseimicrobium gellanilyticum]